MFLKNVSATFALAAVATSLIPAHAATRPATFTVSAVVLNSCQASASRIAATTEPAKAACSSATPYIVSASAGQSVPAAAAGTSAAGAQEQVRNSSPSYRSQSAIASDSSSGAIFVTITY